MPLTDVHLHFFSYRFFEMLAQQKSGGSSPESLCRELGWTCPPKDPAELGQHWAAELDKFGVTRAALIASLPGDAASVAAAVQSDPRRFVGFFFVNPLAPDSLEAAEDALARGLRGLCLLPVMHGFSMASDTVRPFLELAAAHPRSAVFVQSGVLSVGVRKKLGLPSKFDMRYANPLELHPAALRYPQVQFIVPHFGAGFFREALMLCDLCPNVSLDTSSSNSWMRFHTPALTLEQVFDRALEVAGPDRLLFGTDSSYFPRGWNAEIFRAQIEALEKLKVSSEVTEAIFGGNFNRLFPD